MIFNMHLQRKYRNSWVMVTHSIHTFCYWIQPFPFPILSFFFPNNM